MFFTQYWTKFRLLTPPVHPFLRYLDDTEARRQIFFKNMFMNSGGGDTLIPLNQVRMNILECTYNLKCYFRFQMCCSLWNSFTHTKQTIKCSCLRLYLTFFSNFGFALSHSARFQGIFLHSPQRHERKKTSFDSNC